VVMEVNKILTWYGNSMTIRHNVKKRFMKVSKTSFIMETISLIINFDYIC
jgi:hypothetical protein